MRTRLFKYASEDEAGREGEIVEIDCYPALLRLKKPLVMSTYRLDDGPVLFVRVRAHDGHEGWGEAAANAVMSGENLAGMAAALQAFVKPQLIGKSVFERARLMREVRSSVFGNGAVIAAVDMALLDLAARIRGVPAVEMLGGPMRRTVTVLRLIGGSGQLEADVDEAKQLAAAGYRAFKLKVGVSCVDDEIETIRALRNELGPDVLIAADANMGWRRTDSIRFMTGATASNLAFLEQPTPAGDIASLAEIRIRSQVPISIDESMHGLHDLQAHLQAKAIDGLSLKTIKLGGITPLVTVATVADSLGLSINLAMMMESGLATCAMVHAACAVPAVDWGLSLGAQWLSNNPFPIPECVEGAIACPQGPGWGVDVDVATVKSLAP
jgi:muconate cycloisomerase